MLIATATLESANCNYSQSKHYEVPKLEKESAADYEIRTWRERVHADDKTGYIYIPCNAFKNCVSEAAKFLSISVPGKGKTTYTKHFEAGIMVMEHLHLPIKKSEVLKESIFVPSDGKRGGGTRVTKIFPLIPSWSGSVQFCILDHTITRDVFAHVLAEAGRFIGIGRFRPRNNGYYGRFDVKRIDWSEQ